MEFLKNALKEVGDNFKKEFNKAQMEQKEKLKKEKIFKATKRIGNLIAFDDVNKMFMTPCDLRKKIYEYSQILDFELLEDGESITQGGLGKALVGGALFGGVGAVVGGVTGKRKNKGVCTSLKIKITLNDMKTPSIMIDFLTKPIKKSSKIYQKSFKNAHECISILNIACQRQNDTNSVDTNTNIDNSSSNSTADEILKFKSLLDCGAITQEEFDKKKRELL